MNDKIIENINTTTFVVFDTSVISEKMENGGEINSLTQELTVYKTVASGATFTEVLYLGFSENDADPSIQDTDMLEEDGAYDIIAEKQTNTYKFVGELDADIYDSIQEMINDYPLEDYYEDESVWELINEGDWETLETEKKDRVNAATDELIEKVQDYINDKYVKDRDSSKYMEISVYSDDNEDDYLGCIQIRVADHSQNANNLSKSGCKEHLSIVIANKNATKSRFIPLGREIYFTDSDSFESIISEVENEIEDLIEKVKSSVYKNGGQTNEAKMEKIYYHISENPNLIAHPYLHAGSKSSAIIRGEHLKYENPFYYTVKVLPNAKIVKTSDMVANIIHSKHKGFVINKSNDFGVGVV